MGQHDKPDPNEKITPDGRQPGRPIPPSPKPGKRGK